MMRVARREAEIVTARHGKPVPAPRACDAAMPGIEHWAATERAARR
jgi:hypothetical protein